MDELKAAELRRHIKHKMNMGEIRQDTGQTMLSLLNDDHDLTYAQAFEQASFPPMPEIVYHTAPTSARESILYEGLRITDPREGNFGGLTLGQMPGVYVAPEPDTKGVWSHWNEWDVWEVNTEGNGYAHDRLNPGCWRLAKPVPPQALTLVGTFTYDNNSGRIRTEEN